MSAKGSKAKPKKLDYFSYAEFLENPKNPKGAPLTSRQNIVIRDLNNRITDIGYRNIENVVAYSVENPFNTPAILEEVIEKAYKIDKTKGLFFDLLYATGSRIGDVVDPKNPDKKIKGLRVGDIDFKNNMVMFRGAKRQLMRVTPLPEYIIESLKEYIQTNGLTEEGFLFPAQSSKLAGEPASQDPFRNMFNELFEETLQKNGLTRPKGYSVHDAFRDGYIERFLAIQDGVDVQFKKLVTGQLVGHTDANVTWDAYMSKMDGKERITPVTKKSAQILSAIERYNFIFDAIGNIKPDFDRNAPKSKTKPRKKRTYETETKPIIEPSPEEIQMQEIEQKRAVFPGQEIEKVPFGQEEELLEKTIYTDKDYQKRYRQLERGGKGVGYVIGKMNTSNAEAAVNLLNLENKVILNLTDDLTVDNAKLVIGELLEKANYNNYWDASSEKINDLLNRSMSFEYNPNDLMDTKPDVVRKTVDKDIRKSMPGAGRFVTDETNWFSNRGLDELVDPKLRVGGVNPKITLDREVLRQILLQMEENSFKNVIANKLLAQLQHFNLPENIKKLPAQEQLQETQKIFKTALRKVASENPQLFAGLSKQQVGDVLAEVNSLITASNSAVQRVEFSSLAVGDLKKIVQNNPQAFPEIVEMAGKYGEDFITRARLEPYIQFLAQNDVLPKNTYIAGISQNWGVQYEKSLKQQSKTLLGPNFTPEGLPEKTTYKWLFDLRTNYWDDIAEELFNGEGLKHETGKTLPIFNLDNFNIQEEQPSDPAVADLESDDKNKRRKTKPKLKPRGKTIRWGIDPLATLLGGCVLTGAVKKSTAILLTEGIPHVALVDMSGQGQGVFNDPIGESVKITDNDGELLGELFPNVSRGDIFTQLSNLPDDALKEVLSWTEENWQSKYGDLDEVDTGFWTRHVEEIKDWARLAPVVGSAVEGVNPLGGYMPASVFSKEIDDPATRMIDAAAEQDIEEASDPELIGLRRAVTKETIQTDRSDDLFRRLGNVRMSDEQIERLKKQENVYGIFFDDQGELKDDANRRERVRQLQFENQVEEDSADEISEQVDALLTNQKEKNDAVNAGL